MGGIIKLARLSPTSLVIAACALQVVIWTLVPTWLNTAPPLDVVEGYAWGREWVIGTYKHPALPSWVLEGSRLLTGAVGWPAYLISQIFVVTTLGLVYALGREAMDDVRAAAATLLQFGIHYFSWPTPEFNHNIAQMPVTVGFCWALWRAVEHGGPWRWALLGLVAGVGLYTKLSVILLCGVGGLWLLYDGKGRAALSTPGPWIAVAVTVVMIMPLIKWQLGSDFEAVRYATQRVKFRSVGLIGFLAAHVGMLAMLMVAVGRRAPWPALGSRDAAENRWLAFIVTMWLGLIVVMVGAAASAGVGMRAAWFASFSSMSGLVAVTLVAPMVTPLMLRRIASGALVALIAIPAAYVADAKWNSRKPAKNLQTFRTQRTNWPQREIAMQLEAAWRRETGLPLRIVIGEMWVAGLVALTAGDQPSVMELKPERSPWVTPERLAKHGALVVWSMPGGVSPGDIVATYLQGAKLTQLTFPLPNEPKREPLTIGYGIIRPRSP